MILTLLLDGIGTGLYLVGLFLPLRISLALSAIAGFILFVANVIDGSIGWAAFQGSLAVMFAWLWWRNGGNRRMKKAARELGAKSKARVDALVEQMKPSPIPVPGGAR
jgi:Flp pilus assembly protein TadB